MPSHAAAAAVTDEVSFTAVPANRPKPSLLMPSALPSEGKIRAASTLNRKMTEMAWATSLSCALMTGAVAAMAEPPQMDEPTPMSVEISEGMRSTLCSKNAVMSAVAMVEPMMGSDIMPTWAICARFSPKPSSTTAACSTFLPLNAMPVCTRPRVGCFQNTAIAMPARMANTGAPMMGNRCPTNQHGNARARHTARPGMFFKALVTVDPSAIERVRAPYA